MFELLANGTVEELTKKISMAGIPYGFGGVARLGEGLIPAEKIIMEHYRLGSTRAILSRSFCDINKLNDYCEIEYLFRINMAALRSYEENLREVMDFSKNQLDVYNSVESIVNAKRGYNSVLAS
jgi:hypothetical protein